MTEKRINELTKLIFEFGSLKFNDGWACAKCEPRKELDKEIENKVIEIVRELQKEQ